MKGKMNKLEKSTVLVLNRNWQAINVRNPAEVFCQMTTDVATGLDISGETMVPVKWEHWINLPIREQDDFVQTANGKIRIPTVVVLANYAKVPKKRPSFSLKSIWLRDDGVCQYTGKKLGRGEGNIDHVLPRSRGGESTWENCVLASKQVNSKKANHLPEEAGLKLKRKPFTPQELPVTFFIQNPFQIADWEYFLIKKKEQK